MVGKIEFPEGVTWSIRGIVGADFLGEGFAPPSCERFYSYANNYVVDIKYDTSKVTTMYYMFTNCQNLTTAPQMDTSNVTTMGYMFNQCNNLTSVPQMDTSNVTTMRNMFYYCAKLTSVPQMDTSNVTDMQYMFNQCNNLTSVPQLDTSSVTNMSNMFYYCSNLTSVPQMDVSSVTDASSMFQNCSKLTELPNFNFLKLTKFGASYNCWLYGSKLKKLGVVDCDSITDIGYFFSNAANNNLTDFGGCRNLGKASSVSNTNSAYFMAYAPNLTYESVMNVINLLYDRAANGLSTLTLKLHANHMAMLSADDIAIATNKGWSLTS